MLYALRSCVIPRSQLFSYSFQVFQFRIRPKKYFFWSWKPLFGSWILISTLVFHMLVRLEAVLSEASPGCAPDAFSCAPDTFSLDGVFPYSIYTQKLLKNFIPKCTLPPSPLTQVDINYDYGIYLGFEGLRVLGSKGLRILGS